MDAVFSAREFAHGDRQRLRDRCRCENLRQEELVPIREEGNDQRRHQSRRGRGEEDLAQDSHLWAAIDPGRIQEGLRYGVKRGLQEPDGQGERGDDVEQD